MHDDVDGPAAPSELTLSTLRPLKHTEVVLNARGWLGNSQQRTATETLPHVLDQIETGDAFHNLARLVGESTAPLRGLPFTDSDIYKTLEAIAWLSTSAVPDMKTEMRAQALVELVAKVQQDDGYLNSFVQGSPDVPRYSDPQWGHELYTAGHLFQAAVAAARTGTFPELVNVATRLADHLVSQFPTDGPTYVEGHPIVESALVELYRQTGTPSYLELARWQLEQRGHGWLGEDLFGSAYFLDHEPVSAGGPATGHAVRLLYLLAGAVDVAVETDDTDLLSAVITTWEDLFAAKTYLSGGHGSRHRDEAIGDAFELPPDRAYAETCAAVASFQLNWRLLLATGHARYADAMETALYNAIAVSTSADGKSFFYSNPLQLRTGHDGTNEDAPSQRLPWFRCPCCPPNIARLFASVHDYVATRTTDGLQIHHPTSATVSASVGDGSADILMVTGYPYDGDVRMIVTSDAETPWELSIRIPAWCSRVQVTVGNEAVEDTASGGYVRLRRNWTGRHEVIVSLDMPVQVIHPHPRIDAVRGCVALVRGPVLYCLEQADMPTDVILEDVALTRIFGKRAGGVDLPSVVIDVEMRHTPSEHMNVYSTGEAGTATAGLATLRSHAVPYHLWGSRRPGAMRVWIPIARG